MSREIPLTKGQVAIVDAEDYEWLNQWRWHVHLNHRRYPYAERRRRKADGPGPSHIPMHRVILDAPTFLEVDHRDGNGLNNQRENLRLATRSLNERNKHRQKALASGLPMGVRADRLHFRAQIWRGGRYIHLGMFSTSEAAHAAYLTTRTKFIAEEKTSVLNLIREKT